MCTIRACIVLAAAKQSFIRVYGCGFIHKIKANIKQIHTAREMV